MTIGRKTGGRTKGTPNKATVTVRQNTLDVFDKIGGLDTMAKWAEDNLTEFYKLYGRMAPSDPDALGSQDNPLHTRIIREIVDPGVRSSD